MGERTLDTRDPQAKTSRKVNGRSISFAGKTIDYWGHHVESVYLISRGQ